MGVLPQARCHVCIGMGVAGSHAGWHAGVYRTWCGELDVSSEEVSYKGWAAGRQEGGHGF